VVRKQWLDFMHGLTCSLSNMGPRVSVNPAPERPEPSVSFQLCFGWAAWLFGLDIFLSLQYSSTAKWLFCPGASRTSGLVVCKLELVTRFERL
jgi:hypothetical protein